MPVVHLTPENGLKIFRQISQLHIDNIHGGVMPLLGEGFLSRLYYELAGAPKTGIWCFMKEDRAIGFICGSADIQSTFRYLLLRSFFPLATLIIPSLFSLEVIRCLPGLALYPFRKKCTTSESDAPSRAELLSLAVDDKARRCGIGTSLIESLEAVFRTWHVKDYKVATYIVNEKSRFFYEKMKFRPQDSMVLHKNNVILKFRKNLDCICCANEK